MIAIDELLRIAKELGASDVHITVNKSPVFRISGELLTTKYDKLAPADTERLLNEMLSDNNKKILEDKGEVDFSFSYASIGRFRVNIFRQRGSLAAAIRLLNNKIPYPDQLGIPESVVNLCNLRRGLVLVTGPTGSGKSTTLASLIDKINREEKRHILTLEDPIEYLHKHKIGIVNQREVNSDTMSYANALRAALRQDPDVILVGEMRDLETISTAVTAAETGHLVFSTLHTVGSAKTIDRIIDVFEPHQQQQIRTQLATVLKGVISQQLIKTSDGKGRKAAFEVLLANTAISSLIRDAKSHQIQSVIQTNRAKGMITMDDSLYELYSTGEISKSSALSYAQNIETLQMRM